MKSEKERSQAPKAPWRRVVRRKRTLSGSCWFHLECGHIALRRGKKADERV